MYISSGSKLFHLEFLLLKNILLKNVLLSNIVLVLFIIVFICTNYIRIQRQGLLTSVYFSNIVVYPKKVVRHNRDGNYFHGISFYCTSLLTFKTTSWNGGNILEKHIMLSIGRGTTLNNTLASLLLYTL